MKSSTVFCQWMYSSFVTCMSKQRALTNSLRTVTIVSLLSPDTFCQDPIEKALSLFVMSACMIAARYIRKMPKEGLTTVGGNFWINLCTYFKDNNIVDLHGLMLSRIV
jgi:hypothetical protein